MKSKKLSGEIEEYLKNQRFSPEKVKLAKFGKDQLKSYPLFKNQFLYVTHIASNTISFSKNIHEITGYNESDYNEASWALQIIHPDDRPYIFEAARASYEYGKKHFINDSFNHSFCLNYRISRKNGSYIYIMRQTTFFEIDENMKPISFVSVCSDISYVKSDNRIGWQLIGPDTNGFDLTNLFSKVVTPIGFSFTKKEIEIIQDLADGLQSKEIAEKRFISKHTVDTHRRRILKKSGLANSLELVLFALRNNIVS